MPESAIDLHKDWAGHWDLKRNLHFNHGSFGATPTAILLRQAEFVAGFNREREDFLWGDGQGVESALVTLREAVKPLARMVGADPQDMVFVDNVTDAFSSVIRSLPLGAGDQVLVTDHIYANFPAPLKELARRQGFEIVVAEIAYPLNDENEIVEAILAKVTLQTKLAVIDHITSPTAIIFPVKDIVAALRERGVDTFVDGAHGPGHLPVNVEDIGAAYYTANNHKWLCAPVGSGFLHVRRDRQDEIMPAVGSGGASHDTPFVDRFTWRGTKDMSPHFMVGEAIAYLEKIHPEGWPGIYRRNHALAVAARDILMSRLKIAAPCPEAMVGAIFTLPLEQFSFRGKLRNEMIARFGYGVVATEFNGRPFMRVCAHLYNNLGQYEEMAEALGEIL